MKMFVKSFMAGLLVLAGVEAADATNRYFLCSYEVFEDGRPVVRRIEYYEPDLQAAMRQFDMFLRQLEAQGKAPRNLGCRATFQSVAP